MMIQQSSYGKHHKTYSLGISRFQHWSQMFSLKRNTIDNWIVDGIGEKIHLLINF